MLDGTKIAKQIEAMGATHAACIETQEIPLDASFRAACEQNACGFYNRCWTCPPDAGDIEACMARVKSYPHAVVYQTIHPLEDSYDIDGMREAAAAHNRLTLLVQKLGREIARESLALGAGSCGVCASCTRPEGLPCRYPDLAVTSMETCGVNVSALAKKCGLNYINGQNTVTYFGILLYQDGE